MTHEEIAIVRKEEKALRAASRSFLASEYSRAHRVSDTREMTKTDLVFALLSDRFGSGAVEEALRPYTAQEVAFRDNRGDWKRKTIKTRAAFDRFAAKMEDETREWYARDAEI